MCQAAVQRGWHLEVLGDLGADQSLVELTQRLVVQVRVEIALFGEEPDQVRQCPRWASDVMRRRHRCL